jgi:hypothetical protein
MFVRTKQKGSVFRDDLHEFTNKWEEVPDEEGRGYHEEPNLEVREKKDDKATVVTGEIQTPEVAPVTDGSEKT